MGIQESWHGSRWHDPTVSRGSRPIHQFRSKRYAEDYELISDFETLGDWVWGVGELQTNDAVNFKEGSQGIKWTSINDVHSNAERTITLNCLGKHFELGIYIDDTDNLSNILIFFFTPGAPYFSYWQGPANIRLVAGWNMRVISRASFTAVGGAVDADWADISSVRLQVDSVAGTTVNVTFDDFRMVRDRFAGKVTLRFDDGNEDNYTEARARMDEYGFRGVAAVPINIIGTGGYMSLAQLEHLQERGWDIITHSMTHPHFPALTPAELEAELWNSQRWMTEHGFYKGSRFIVPPFHDVNAAVLEQIGKYYLATQDLHGYDAIPPGPRLAVTAAIGPATGLAGIQERIDIAKITQTWLTLYFHDVADMLVLFQNIIDYIEASGLEVVTFSDVFDELIGSTMGVKTQLLEFGVQGAITANATSYPCPGGGVAAQTANEIKIPISKDGWLKNLRVRQRVASGAGGRTDIYTIRVNGADTDLTGTLDNVTVGSDLVNNARVSEGDDVSISLVSNDGADTSADISVTVELELLM